ncbi:dihydrolipoamide acetyltransferase family protein [Haloarcula sediminis]|uniref:dihydrolipoamide acetyltransferase family protein n=1 Tax=Haloarcula sediminis TaxID=3111777 RepID=UPI002D79DDDA|nr:dihydrolipoamide acetyltransferase family protein [Haloarcula sp. CK38]
MFEFELPDLGDGVAEGEVLTWHVTVGDEVAKDQVLAEVETDKATVDVSSPVAGVVRARHADVGDTVATGEVLATIGTDSESEESPTDSDEQADESSETNGSDGDTAGRVFAPPSVRRLARELGVDISAIEGSGPSGRITESDVETTADDTAADTDDGPTSVVSKVNDDTDDGPTSVVSKVNDDTDDGPTSVVSKVNDDTDDGPTSVVSKVNDDEDRSADDDSPTVVVDTRDDTDDPAAESAVRRAAPESTDDRREPYRGARRTTGERMARSRREVPHETHHDMVAVPELVEARERLTPLAEERGVDLTYTPLVLKCVAATLDDHPMLASRLDTEREEVVYRSDRDIGVATATDDGLVVPVVEAVDEKGLLELAGDVDDLVGRARSRDTDQAALQGGVFTVTNVGAIGGEYADPIINVPETAVLSVGALRERPVASDGEVTAEPTLTLSLAIDRRVLDGADAARFLNTLKEYLADPTRLLA